MDFTTDSISRIRFYFYVVVVFWIVCLYLLATYGYQESFLILNRHHSPYLDPFVPHLTNFGDSLILSSLILVILSYKDAALSLTTVTSIIASGLALVCFKQFIFTEWHRPLVVIGQEAGIHFIQGHVEYYKSFPSGHTTTLFSAFPMLAYYFRNRLMQVSIAIAAILLSYTRIYLGSHFLGDVLAGSLLGTSFALLALFVVYPKMKKLSGLGAVRKATLWMGVFGLMLGIYIRYFL